MPLALVVTNVGTDARATPLESLDLHPSTVTITLAAIDGARHEDAWSGPFDVQASSHCGQDLKTPGARAFIPCTSPTSALPRHVLRPPDVLDGAGDDRLEINWRKRHGSGLANRRKLVTTSPSAVVSLRIPSTHAR